MVRRKRRFGLARETEIMEKAARRKLNRFTSSGLIVIVVGVLVIFAGFALHTGAYSLIIGIGAITVLVGIIRALIGLINPSTPADLRYVTGEPLPGDIIEENEEGGSTSDSKESVSLEELTYQQPLEE